MIAALYVQTGGVYFDLDGVDPWDEARDARSYPGPFPVIAHPPCARWCRLAAVNESRYGHKIGDDGGCFASALAAVRKWGGVIEHPAFTLAWKRHGLLRPTAGLWTRSLFDVGWVASVYQRNYGHPANKRTWLYYVGDTLPPALDWSAPDPPLAWISSHRPRAEIQHVRQLSKKEASASPVAFRDLLISMARSA